MRNKNEPVISNKKLLKELDKLEVPEKIQEIMEQARKYGFSVNAKRVLVNYLNNVREES